MPRELINKLKTVIDHVDSLKTSEPIPSNVEGCPGVFIVFQTGEGHEGQMLRLMEAMGGSAFSYKHGTTSTYLIFVAMHKWSEQQRTLQQMLALPWFARACTRVYYLNKYVDADSPSDFAKKLVDDKDLFDKWTDKSIALRLNVFPNRILYDVGESLPDTIQCSPTHFTHVLAALRIDSVWFWGWTDQFWVTMSAFKSAEELRADSEAAKKRTGISTTHSTASQLGKRNISARGDFGGESFQAPICRSYWKLREAFDRNLVHQEARGATSAGGDASTPKLALDLGSAPGGWTQCLAEHGFRVYAIDPAEMDARMAEHANVVHVRKRAEQCIDELRAVAPFDFLCTDIIAMPRESVSIVKPFVELLRDGGVVVLTLKLPKRKQSTIDSVWTPEMIELVKSSMGLDEVRVHWLINNSRMERTVVGVKH